MSNGSKLLYGIAPMSTIGWNGHPPTIRGWIAITDSGL
jgi:hypothetical protein